jgi:hypothetical protein
MNACFSIRDNLEPDSNLTDESDLNSEKHSSPSISIDLGISISTKPVPLNAHPSIRDNLEFDSNATKESDSHLPKQF